MTDRDFYKERQRKPIRSEATRRKPAGRHHQTNRLFDENRRRRSRNSGSRRLAHLMRKSVNEKYIWISIVVGFAIFFLLLAFWQFIIREQNIYRTDEETPTKRDNASITFRDGLEPSPPFSTLWGAITRTAL